MATQGIVSITNNGQMMFKVVAGSSGYNAARFAEWAKTHPGTFSNQVIYNAALKLSFGDKADLVVQASDGSFTYDKSEIVEVGELYCDYNLFLNPRFNPRWEIGQADYIEVVDLVSQVQIQEGTPNPQDCQTLSSTDGMEVAVTFVVPKEIQEQGRSTALAFVHEQLQKACLAVPELRFTVIVGRTEH
jgi:hypothetical protein